MKLKKPNFVADRKRKTARSDPFVCAAYESIQFTCGTYNCVCSGTNIKTKKNGAAK